MSPIFSRSLNATDAPWLAICSLSLLAMPAVCNADWPVVRGDPASTGVASGSFPPKPELVWEYKTNSDQAGFEGSPVIADGAVFAADFDGGIHAIDLASGTKIWMQKYKDGFLSAPAVKQGKVVLGDMNGFVFCLDAKSGEPIWKREIDQPVSQGPNFHENNVLISSEGGSMFSLSLATGEPKWTYQTGDQLRSSPSIWKTFTLLGGCDGRLHKIDIVEGKATGDGYALDAPTLSTPAVVGNIAIVPNQPGVVRAIDVSTDKILWTFADQDAASDIRSSPACISTGDASSLRGTVVVTTRNRRVLGLELETGKLIWEHVLKKRADASPVICDSRVWVASENGLISALDIRSGEELWSYQLSGQILASPVAVDGKLVVATAKGSVVCFGKK